MTKLIFPCLIFGLILSGLPAFAQNESNCKAGNSWKEIFLMDTLRADTCLPQLLLVTNRSFKNNKKKLFPDQISSGQKARYVLASCCEEGWGLCVLGNFNEAIKILNLNSDILFFVHGNGKSFPAVLNRAEKIRKLYGVNVIVFDWPSENFSLARSIRRAEASMDNFVLMMSHLRSARDAAVIPEESRVSLMMHSLGNFFLFRFINQHRDKCKRVVFDNIIINSAAVSTKGHAKALDTSNIQERIYVISNKNDRTLRGAQLISLSKMLGINPRPVLSQKAIYLDFTPYVDKEHTFFIGLTEAEKNHPFIKDLYSLLIHGQEIPSEKLINNKLQIR